MPARRHRPCHFPSMRETMDAPSVASATPSTSIHGIVGCFFDVRNVSFLALALLCEPKRGRRSVAVAVDGSMSSRFATDAATQVGRRRAHENAPAELRSDAFAKRFLRADGRETAANTTRRGPSEQRRLSHTSQRADTPTSADRSVSRRPKIEGRTARIARSAVGWVRSQIHPKARHTLRGRWVVNFAMRLPLHNVAWCLPTPRLDT